MRIRSVFHQLVLVQIIELTSELGSLRVLEEMGAAAAAYRTWGLPTLYLCPFPAWAPLLSRLASAHAHGDRWALILCDACAAAALP